MVEKLQIYISDNFNPYENLATEKYLLDNTADDCYILYLWQNQNTVVIGRNQNPWVECKCSLLEEDGGKLARRLSGGGAVFHDLGNLNFTFLCSTENYDLTKNLQVIQEACSMAGIHTEVSGRNDILADGGKFSGNAFYNAKGKSYHHGTLMISADTERMQRYLTPPKAKLQAKGIKSVKSRVVNLSQLSQNLTCEDMKKHMISAFEKVYGMKADLLKDIDKEYILNLADKYGSWEYLYGTPLPFSFECEDKFDWGYVQLQMEVTDGVIKSVQLYTDSMDWTLPELLQKALINCRFDIKDIKNAITGVLPQGIAEDLIYMLKKQEL